MSTPTSSHSKASFSKATILIVDDMPANLIALEAVLCDYNVLSAHSGKEALDLFQKNAINVVLMDIQMPGMDGFETARQIRQMENYNNVPIIFVTAIFKEDPYIKK